MRNPNEIIINGKILTEVLALHAAWKEGSVDGVRAILRWANLHGTDLHAADLYGADLRYTNFSAADLSDASLRNASLTGADLSDANLRGATGPFSTFFGGRHHAVAAGGYASIACERHTIAEWRERGQEIGRANNYSDAEIERYMAWIATLGWLE